MANPDDRKKRPRPICGCLSLALPLMPVAAGFIALRLAPEGDSGSLGLFVLLAYSLAAAMIAGVVLAIIALVRRERWRGLPWITLVLNLIASVIWLKQLAD